MQFKRMDCFNPKLTKITTFFNIQMSVYNSTDDDVNKLQFCLAYILKCNPNKNAVEILFK